MKQIALMVVSVLVLLFAIPVTANEQLVNAIKNNNIDVVRGLLNNGADPNQEIGSLKSTPLKMASGGYSGEKLEIVILLIRSGADVNKANRDKDTPLMSAALTGHLNICKELIKNGADVNAINDDGATALRHAAQKGDLSTVKLLLDNGANPNLYGKDEYTPLFMAAMGGHIDVIKVLIQAKADSNYKTKSGETAVSIAEMFGKTEVIKLLQQ